jgi:hypothetical protein
MASLKFPLSVAGKQQALFVKPLPANELSAWGQTYQDGGQLYDALEFFQAAQDRPAMEALCEKAVDGADLVLFLNVCRALGSDPSPAKLQALQQRALASGLESVAKRVHTLLAPQT